MKLLIALLFAAVLPVLSEIAISRNLRQGHRELQTCDPSHICLQQSVVPHCLTLDPKAFSVNAVGVRDYVLKIDNCEEFDPNQHWIISGGYMRSLSTVCPNCCVGLAPGEVFDDFLRSFSWLSVSPTCAAVNATTWAYDSSRPCFTMAQSGNVKCLHMGGYDVGIADCTSNYDYDQCWDSGAGVV